MQDQSSLRIGCVEYLNARPLIHGWDGEVEFGPPSALCTRLARGDLDVALVSSLEYLRNPIYRIVDDVSISSDGAVYSVVIAHRGDLTKITQIELDPASETSVALLRYLLLRRQLDADLVTKSDAAEARLLIGDKAIRFRQSNPDFDYWDLGAEWKKIIDLPFVYALWLIRPEVAEPESVARRLRELRNQNLSRIDDIIRTEREFDQEFCSRYYREHLRFSFGDREKQGLQTFAIACAELDLIPKREPPLDLV